MNGEFVAFIHHGAINIPSFFKHGDLVEVKIRSVYADRSTIKELKRQCALMEHKVILR